MKHKAKILPTKNIGHLTKGAMFTDIHWGAKANSEQHNEDCMNFIDWFCANVSNDPSIDHILFLGDWFENRSALNIATLNWAYKGAQKLNSLDLPVFFIIGNHDLYHRHTREVYSVITFKEFTNFHVIDEPTLVESIGNGALLCPYLFHEEYPNLIKYNNFETWWGHFEFQGFVVTGQDREMPTGPTHKDFHGPKRIFSGHFHKRQTKENVIYIGNAFPLTFGDAGDTKRGMAIYDHTKDKLTFIDWGQCPKYIKLKLTDLLEKNRKIHPSARVKCIVDVPISFEESTALRQSFTEKYNLREFALEESYEIRQALSETEISLDLDDTKILGIDELVEQMLREIDSQHINNQKLITIYNDLKI